MDDPEDKKPDGWVEEKRIVDAKAKKPDDWDDEEDGDSDPRVWRHLNSMLFEANRRELIMTLENGGW